MYCYIVWEDRGLVAPRLVKIFSHEINASDFICNQNNGSVYYYSIEEIH